jgi:hypothetical protein
MLISYCLKFKDNSPEVFYFTATYKFVHASSFRYIRTARTFHDNDHVSYDRSTKDNNNQYYLWNLILRAWYPTLNKRLSRRIVQ